MFPASWPLLILICRALKQERKTELQLAAAQTKVKKLRRRCKKLQETSDGDKTETADAFLAFAKNDCLEFCTQVHKTFPREIRDTIYGYITGCEDVNVNHNNLHDPQDWSQAVRYYTKDWQDQLFVCPWENHVDHWWKSEYVGAAMVRELGESFYRSSCFVFQEDLAAFAPFRATDPWKFGFPPVDFVSLVEVRIECRKYKFKLADRTDADPSVDEPLLDSEISKMLDRQNAFIEVEQQQLLVQLESLFGFRPGTKITFKLLTCYAGKFTELEQQEWMSHNVVPVILPILQRLKTMGCRVRILLEVDYFGPSKTFASSWDQICLEAITKEFWEVC